MRLSVYPLAAAAAGLLAETATSLAQTNAPIRLPTVLVTADRLTANDTRLTESDLASSKFEELPDLAKRAANLAVADSSLRGYGDVVTLRGLGNTPFFSGPGVVVTVDGVPLGDPFARATQLHDLEAVEVSRGAQATRVGRNAEAGVIELRTRRPGNEYRGEATVEYGSYEAWGARFRASGPLSQDQVYLGVSGYHRVREGFVRNTHLDKTVDDQDALGGRMELRWTPTPEWEVRLQASIERFDDGMQRIVPLRGDEFKIASDLDGVTQIDRNDQTLIVERRFDAGTLTSRTARQDWDLDPSTLDIDFTPTPLFTTDIRQSQEQWSQELRFDSDDDGRQPVFWNVGVFYLTSDVRGDTLRGFVGAEERLTYRLNEDNYAIFGEFGFRPVESLTLKAGLRLDKTDKAIGRTATDLFFKPEPIFRDKSFYNAAPTFDIEWAPSPAWRVFGRMAMGFKPGGYSAFTDDPKLAEFTEERIYSGEVGVAWRGWNDRANVTLRGFWNEIDDYQVERTFGVQEYIVLNAEEVTGRGIELEADVTPLAGLRFAGAFGYQLTEFDDFRDPFTGVDYSGNRVPYSPDFTLRLLADYRHEDTGLGGRVEWLAAGDTFYNDANDPFFKQASFGVLNVRAGWDHKHFGIHVFALNVTDERYFVNKTVDIQAGVPGAPRTVGVEVTGRF